MPILVVLRLTAFGVVLLGAFEYSKKDEMEAGIQAYCKLCQCPRSAIQTKHIYLNSFSVVEGDVVGGEL